MGKIEVESGTFPFAIDVKIKYQSVHGVTRSNMKPSHNAGWSDKNIAPNPHAKRGVQTKLIMTDVLKNLTFFKEFSILVSGTVTNYPYNKSNKNGSISAPACFSKK